MLWILEDDCDEPASVVRIGCVGMLQSLLRGDHTQGALQ